jgi:type IV pilus assembly protein PilA
MLIKMKESKGFTLVELMIVVAIIGILAAVAVPFYQRYVNKARLTSQVFPGMHAIETNIGTFFAVRNVLPPSGATNFYNDASTACFTPTWGTSLSINVNTTSTTCGMTALRDLTTPHIIARPVLDTTSGKITRWDLTGTLVDELGLQ